MITVVCLHGILKNIHSCETYNTEEMHHLIKLVVNAETWSILKLAFKT